MYGSTVLRGRRRLLVVVGAAIVAIAMAAAAMTPADAATAAPAGDATVASAAHGHAPRRTVSGRLVSAGRPLARTDVALYAAVTRGSAPVLARTRSHADGAFTLTYRPGSAGATLYVIAGQGHSARLASVLGPEPLPRRIVVNDRTTVAAGYALAQFIRGTTIIDNAPGTANGAAMTRDLVDPTTGGLSRVLTTTPNGSQTTALRTFNSLSDLVALCARDGATCRTLLQLATPAGGARPYGTLQAIADIARNPAHNAAALYALSRRAGNAHRPALAPQPTVTSWGVLAVRFSGDGHTLDGPGNSAIDAHGYVWVTNNYEYSSSGFADVCGSKDFFKFTPTGHYASRSPFTGGGVNGSGYGITIDPHGNIWEGNFGFSSVDCTSPPPHNSVSEFAPSGRALSPSPTDTSGGGFTQGGIDWPQGTVSDRRGNIWVANCADNSVTRIPDGDAGRARNISLNGVGVTKPFDIAFNQRGQAFVDGNTSDSVAMLNPDGTAAQAAITGGGLDMPLGMASDIAGNIWVADSASVNVPCSKGILHTTGTPAVTLIRSDGTVDPVAFTGGGISMPWGIAVDGNDNVWIANFVGQRVSELCGVAHSQCPPGTRTGQALSPKNGYAFDGLARNTSVQIDPTGNVWITNNWKLHPPILRNPGGYEMVVFIGAAGPVRTPLIGPPQSIWNAPMR